MKTKVKTTKNMGRGVFANRDFTLGQTIEVSPCITWDHRTEKLIQDSDLKFYVFSGDVYSSVLALGVGSLFNHAVKGKHNVTYQYNKDSNEVVFTAARKIKKGSQLLIHYGYNPVEKLKRWNKHKKDILK